MTNQELLEAAKTNLETFRDRQTGPEREEAQKAIHIIDLLLADLQMLGGIIDSMLEESMRKMDMEMTFDRWEESE